MSRPPLLKKGLITIKRTKVFKAQSELLKSVNPRRKYKLKRHNQVDKKFLPPFSDV